MSEIVAEHTGTRLRGAPAAPSAGLRLAAVRPIQRFRPGPVGAGPRPQRPLGGGAEPADHRSDGTSGRRGGRPYRVRAEHLVSTAYLSGEIAQTSGGEGRGI